MADLLRVSLMGTLPTGEEWSVNPVFSIGGDFGAPVSNIQAQTIATAISAITIPTGVRNMLATSCFHTGCRVEARALDGTLESLAEAVRTAPISGSGTTSHPFQTSIVSSLRTAQPGQSGRGRLYWPATGAGLDAPTLRLTAANALSFVQGVSTYLGSIESAIDTTLDGVSLAVWSRKLLNLYPVTSLQIGDVLDVQRRRRDQLVEAYQTVSF